MARGAAWTLLAMLGGCLPAPEQRRPAEAPPPAIGTGPRIPVSSGWSVTPTLPLGTDDRYDNSTTREVARRKEEDELAARRRGEAPPDMLTPLLRATRLDRGPLARLARPGAASADSDEGEAAGAAIVAAARRQLPATPPAAPRQRDALALRAQGRAKERLAGPLCPPAAGERVAAREDPAELTAQLRACLRTARDTRERTRWSLLLRLAEGATLRSAATTTGLRLICAQQVQARFQRLRDPAVRLIVQPRAFIRNACHEGGMAGLGGDNL